MQPSEANVAERIEDTCWWKSRKSHPNHTFKAGGCFYVSTGSVFLSTRASIVGRRERADSWGGLSIVVGKVLSSLREAKNYSQLILKV